MALLSKAPPPPPTQPSLVERVEALHEAIEAAVDAFVAADAKANPGIPQVRIKHDLMVRMGWCMCEAAKFLEKQP